VLPLEFVTFGTPISAQGSSESKRLWKQRVRQAAYATVPIGMAPTVDSVVLRVAYFYVYAPAADLDNIVKPIQDALRGIAYVDDVQVIDLVASMRRKSNGERIVVTTILASGFAGGSDFVHVAVDHSSAIEVFR